MKNIEKKINLCISKHCFLKCKGCYNNFCNLDEISKDNIYSFLKYAKRNGLEKVTISGGDPLTRKDIELIIQDCLNLNLKVNLDTVGLPFIETSFIYGTKQKIDKFNNLELLKKIDTIGIPLDGSNNEIISTFRIYQGNLFEKTIKILNFFEEQKIKICINTVLHKMNEHDIQNIFNIIKKYNCIKKWQVFQFMPIGPLGKKNEDKFSLEKSTFISATKKIHNTRNDLEIIFKTAEERDHNYMLINSSGIAYKVYLDNRMEYFGNICNKDSWDNILKNLY